MSSSAPRRRRRGGARPRTPGTLWLVGFGVVVLAALCGLGLVATQLPDDDLPASIDEVPDVAALELEAGTDCGPGVEDEALTARIGLDAARSCALGRIDAQPESPTGWLALVELDAVRGAGLSTRQRRAVLDAVEQFHPDASGLDRARAAHDLARGDGVAALGAFERSMSPISRRHELDAYLALGLYERAEDRAAELVAADPTDEHACLALVDARWGRADWRGAEQAATDCVEGGAPAGALIARSAWIADATGRVDVAESRYVAADAKSELGALLWQTGRDSERVDALLAGAPDQLAWRALAYGETVDGGSGLAAACAHLAAGRSNEALALADEHADTVGWQIVRARALTGTPAAADAWAAVTRADPDNPHAWRGRLAAAQDPELAGVLSDLGAVDPQRAVLRRGDVDRDAPWEVLVPDLWDDVLDRVPDGQRDLVLLWAGRPGEVRGGPALVRSAALSELGRGAEAHRLATGDTAQHRTARVAALLAQGRTTDAQVELVAGLDEDEPALRGQVVFLLVARGDAEAARQAASVVLAEHPGWQTVRNALTSLDPDG